MSLPALVALRSLSVWGAALLFALPLARKPYFWLRSFAFLVVYLAANTAFSFLAPPLWFGIPMAMVFYLLGVAQLFFCGQLRRHTAPYCAVWSGTAFLLMRGCYHLLAALLPGPDAFWAAVALAAELALTAILARLLPQGDHYEVGPRQLLFALLVWGLLCALYQAMLYTPPAENMTRWLLLLACQLYVATLLYLSNALFRKSALKQELDTLNLLWHQQKLQYEMAKADVELINRKCHDLKHQVAALRAMGDAAAREPYLQEIETLVEQYDSIVRTGNEVLDTILTQKSRYAEAHRIRINCVAQGEATAFLDPVDLYTMLGNALDNAIEYVNGAKREEQRIIDVLIRAKQRFLSITISNPLHTTLPQFEGGLPLTTKAKNGYHGFGIKSIRHTAQKYGGYLTLDTAADTFTLRLLLPLPCPSEKP